MKKSIILSLVTITLLLLTSCAKEPIKIGFSGNLTGTGSELGTNAMYGAYMAVDEINASGGINGRPVELIVKNDGNDINTAVDADKELIEEGVVGIIGHLLSGNGQLAIPYINENDIIMISPTISSSAYADQEDLFLTLMPVSSHQSEKLSQILKNHNHENVGLLYQEANKAYAQNVVDDFRAYYEGPNHNVILYEAFDTHDQSSYSSLVHTITESDLDALIIVGTGYDLAKFTQSFALVDYEIPIYGPVWAMTNELLINAGPTANGVHLINYYDEGNDAPTFKAFHDKYNEKYGNDPAFGAAFSYEATKVLVEGIRLADSTESEAIRDAIIKQKEFVGLQSNIVFDIEGDATRELFLFEVINESFVKVDK